MSDDSLQDNQILALLFTEACTFAGGFFFVIQISVAQTWAGGIFEHIHCLELRKSQYGCYITTDIDLSMKYKRHIRFHDEI